MPQFLAYASGYDKVTEPDMCRCIPSAGVLAALILLAASAVGADQNRPTLENPEAAAKTEAEMKPYAELVEHTDAVIEMVPIRGGEYVMGSPESEADRNDDEARGKRIGAERTEPIRFDADRRLRCTRWWLGQRR